MDPRIEEFAGELLEEYRRTMTFDVFAGYRRRLGEAIERAYADTVRELPVVVRGEVR